MRLALLSVNTGTPTQIGEQDGDPVISAIGKTPVETDTIVIAPDGIVGDAQADRTVHGGADKALYVYPDDNWPWWRDKMQFPCAPGAFGENLTVSGADETTVRIGDRFQWGETVLEVCQPRSPCYKFQMYSGRLDAAALMTISGRCGWYLRVLEPGEVRIDASMDRIFEGDGATVREAFHAAFNRRLSRDVRAQIAAHSALSQAWRAMIVGG
ncbi:MAG: MOSC domain-containing protein [Hyphomonadaceae bacterium]